MRKPILLALFVVAAAAILLVTFFAALNPGSPSKGSASTVGVTPTSPAYPTSIAALLPNPGFEDGLAGWVLGRVQQDGTDILNQDYTLGTDTSVKHSGSASVHVRATDLTLKNIPRQYAYISTRVRADIFRGKRVRFSAYLRSQDRQAQAGLWMWVPGIIDGRPTDPSLPMAWDSTFTLRNVHDTTDWTKIEIVLDIPQQASYLLLGMQASTVGQEWMDDAQLEVVGTDVPTTDRGALTDVSDLDFEQGLSMWDTGPAETGTTEVGTSTEAARSGKLGAYITHTGGGTEKLGGLAKAIYGQFYRDKKVRVSAYMNVDKMPLGAILDVTVYYLDANGDHVTTPIIDDAQVFPADSGPKGWQRIEATVNVPDRASVLTFGIAANGDGEVWIDDVQIDILGPADPTHTPR